MTFFKKSQTPAPAPVQRSFTPPSGGSRGDRTLAQRIETPDVPSHRQNGVKSTAKVDRVPRGCLFKVSGGYFDLDGYWCVPKADKQVQVTRGSPKRILRLLNDHQKKELARVRLNARRRGMR